MASRPFAGVVEAVAGGDRIRALNIAMDVIRAGTSYPQALQHVFGNLRREGLTAIEGEDLPDVLRQLGEWLMRQGDYPGALDVLDAMLALEPDSTIALREAATASIMTGDLDRSRHYYRRAVALDPFDRDALAGLASVAARQLHAPEARDAGLRSLAIDPHSVAAQLAVAQADVLDGAPSNAIDRLMTMMSRTDLDEQHRIAILDLRADAFDAAGQVSEAFTDYTARNVIIERANAPWIRAQVPERKVIEARRLAGHFETRADRAWADRAPGMSSRPDPVFIVGFARTGTTLIEKALAGHPAITTLADATLLGTDTDALFADDAAIARLLALPEVELDRLRAHYWANADLAAGGRAGPVVVDRTPFNIVRLPLISRLFPDAKILFAVRDPRDVVLSCFRRRFPVDAVSYEFLTLRGAAAHYDSVMRQALAARSILPLASHDVRHERLVTDFDGEIGHVLAFLGLGWDDDVRDIASRAGSGFTTPSDARLANGLTASGVAQWRRYAAQLEPVHATLALWVAHFGYGEVGAA